MVGRPKSVLEPGLSLISKKLGPLFLKNSDRLFDSLSVVSTPIIVL